MSTEEKKENTEEKIKNKSLEGNKKSSFEKVKEYLNKFAIFSFVGIAIAVFFAYEYNQIAAMKTVANDDIEKIKKILEKTKKVYSEISSYEETYNKLISDVTSGIKKDSKLKDFENFKIAYADKLINEFKIHANMEFNPEKTLNLSAYESVAKMQMNFLMLKHLYEISGSEDLKFRENVLNALSELFKYPNVTYRIISYKERYGSVYQSEYESRFSMKKIDLIIDIINFIKKESNISDTYLNKLLSNLSETAYIGSLAKIKDENNNEYINVTLYTSILKSAFEAFVIKTTFKNKDEIKKHLPLKLIEKIFPKSETRYKNLIEYIAKIQNKKSVEERVDEYNRLIYQGFKNGFDSAPYFEITELNVKDFK
jgi:hypothetical protein